MVKRATAALSRLVVLIMLLSPLTAGAQTASGPSATSSLLVKLVSGLSMGEQAAVIARNGGVETSSIPALRLHVVEVPPADLASVLAAYQADPLVQSAEVNRTRQFETIPADPLYAYQWALPRIGWEQAFGGITPAGSARVALLDTGVDASHPELAGKVVPGISMLDSSDGRTDSSGHGTALAGIIAADTDSTPLEGIAGVAYAGVQIMPVTVLNANGEGQDSDVIRGVLWAADHGADVILMAFSAPEFSPNLQDAIDYAWSKGVVLVAAVGNSAVSTPTFPAGARGVMGVAATDQHDAQAYFSNEGQAVFIAAPGVDIQTIDLNGNYVVLSGTSTAAAHVAGLAAFMKAVDPTLSNGVIVGRIARNADPAGTQDETGNGRINMPRALADTSTEPVQPAGADPVGDGGPFVGPYQAAANITVTIGGTVTDAATAAPLSGASVVCTNCTGNPASRSATTNASGQYTMSPNATTQGSSTTTTVTVEASKPGYGIQSDSNVSVTQSQATTKNFVLSPPCTSPSITSQPTSPTIIYGANATFTAAANANPTPTVQWEVSTDNGVNWNNVSGAISTTLTLTKPGVALSGNRYRAVFTNTCGGTQTGTTNAATLTVNPQALTGSFTANSKEYDGTPTATVGTKSLLGVIDGDVVDLVVSDPLFDSAAVGMTKDVTGSLGLTGADAGNYSVNATHTAKANITARALTGSFTANDKEYDGTPTATVGTKSLLGVIDGDVVDLVVSDPLFDTAAVGMTKDVTGSLSLTGADAGNYTVNATHTAKADITAKVLTGSFTVNDKEYDGTPTATVATKSLPGVISPDVVSLNVTNVLFDTKNVGNNKDVTGSLSLVGTDAGNYTVNSSHTAKANITPRGLTVSASGVNKVYDGTNAATVNLSTDKLNGDDVTAAYASASFADKNVGNGKAVSVSGISISGADAGNYNLPNTAAHTTADITPKSITGSFTAADKVWDGTTAATVLARSLNGAVGGDDVSLSGGTAAFNNANVGGNKPVTLTGATLAGTDAGNHKLSSVADATASILAWNAQGHGFYQPVGLSNSIFVAAPGSAPLWSPATVWSVAKGGSSVPLKFNVYAGGVEKTSPSDIKEFKQVQLASCSDGAGEEMVENLPVSGNTSLRYDTTDRQFIQNWKTPNVSKETCYRATVIFNDDSSLSAFFKLKK